ncbi:ABC transporter ATP-binding protein [Myxococcota bacterium]|nr:ABC transporter ATP-binding protein [Myxococcota bacterium]
MTLEPRGDSPFAIEIHDVSLNFPVVRFRPQGIKEAVLSSFWRKKRDAKDKSFWALKNVSVQVRHGEVLGVVGHNGSGKSTLLKVVAGIYEPDSGRAVTRGRISSLLELGAGFREELTGYENIKLNGAILGFSPEEMDTLLEEIIDFSGIQEFIDQPLRTYSSGMKLRLGFAVAAAIKPDILLIDEVLAVGDEDFRQKSMARLDELVKGETTVVLVSHAAHEIRRLCTRAILLHHGEMLMDASPNEVLDKYHELIGVKKPTPAPAAPGA